MVKRRQILADHKQRGKTLVPPFIHLLGPLHEVSWVNTIIPELCWIGLIQHQHGHSRGVKLITSFARAARNVRSGGSSPIFGAASSYSELSDHEWAQLRGALSTTGDLFQIQESLEPLIGLYPECPLGPIFATPPASSDMALNRMTRLVSSLFRRNDRDPTMVQATFIWLAFDSGVLKVKKGLALAQFPEIEHYPDTEISRKIGGSIRASLNGFFGDEQFYPQASLWPRYFWNRGLALTPCELSDD